MKKENEKERNCFFTRKPGLRFDRCSKKKRNSTGEKPSISIAGCLDPVRKPRCSTKVAVVAAQSVGVCRTRPPAGRRPARGRRLHEVRRPRRRRALPSGGAGVLFSARPCGSRTRCCRAAVAAPAFAAAARARTTPVSYIIETIWFLLLGLP